MYRINLTPKYFVAANGFDDGNVLTGEAYLRIGGKDAVDVGTIAFDSTEWRTLSKACTIDSFNVSYRQKVRIDTGGKELRWELTPKRITRYTASGNTLTIRSSEQYGQKVTSYTNGNDYLDKGGDFVDSTIDKSAIFGTSDLLGFDLVGGNDATFAYRLYMTDLSATLDYTARYYARFYDEDGTTLLKAEIVDGGKRATPPNLTRAGHNLFWEVDGTPYTNATLPTRVDQDIEFVAVWQPKNLEVKVDKPTAGTVQLYREQDGAWNAVTRSYRDGAYHYALKYGDRIKVVATDCNRRSQDLRVSTFDASGAVIAETTFDGSNQTTFDAIDTTLTQDIAIRIAAENVYFTIETSCGEGGTITPTHLALRHGNDNVTVTPSFGYEIETVTIDGNTQEVHDADPLTVPISDVMARHVVSATFALRKIQITFDLPEGVTVEGASEVDFFATESWTFDCGANASFTSLTLDGRELLDVPVFKQVSIFTQEVESITTPITFKAEITDDLATVTIQQTTGGTVTCDKGEGKFIKGTGQKLALSYVTDANYVFAGWFDNIREYPKKITVDGDVTVYAVFEYRALSVNVEVEATVYKDISFSGTVEKSADFAEQGESVTLTAHPDAGASFYTWSWFEIEGGMPKQKHSEENPLALVWSNVQRGKVTAKFWPDMHTLTVNAENGEVDVDGVLFYTGETIQLKATPAEGYYFSHWSDEPSNTSAQRVYIMPQADTEITAVFKKVQYKVSVTGGKEYYPEHGDDLLIPFTAEYGYKLADVLLDGNSVFDNVTLTRRGGTLFLENVTSPHTVEVVFKARIYTNGRKLLDYYPPVIASIREIEKLMDVLQVTDDALWDSVSFVMENQFIDTATAEGVTMWERELGIVASPTESLAQRKARLRLKWVPNNRFTMKWLHEWLEDVCGTTIKSPVVHEKGDYILTVFLPWFVQWVEVFKDLEKYKPANIELDPTVTLPSKDIKLLTGFAMRTHTKYTVYAGEEV